MRTCPHLFTPGGGTRRQLLTPPDQIQCDILSFALFRAPKLTPINGDEVPLVEKSFELLRGDFLDDGVGLFASLRLRSPIILMADFGKRGIAQPACRHQDDECDREQSREPRQDGSRIIAPAPALCPRTVVRLRHRRTDYHRDDSRDAIFVQ